MNNYIVKPFTPQILKEKIDALLSRRGRVTIMTARARDPLRHRGRAAPGRQRAARARGCTATAEAAAPAAAAPQTIPRAAAPAGPLLALDQRGRSRWASPPLPFILERANAEIQGGARQPARQPHGAGDRDGREAAAHEREAASEVTSATEVAATDILDALDRAQGMVDDLDSPTRGRPGARAARARPAARGDLRHDGLPPVPGHHHAAARVRVERPDGHGVAPPADREAVRSRRR